MLAKWKRAVIHLECATDRESYNDREEHLKQQRALLRQGRITHEQYSEEKARRSRNMRFHGTALFLSHSGRRYLLTARHVVWDEQSARRELEEEAERVRSYNEGMRQRTLKWMEKHAQEKIFNIIFRVPSVDEVLANRGQAAFLMNLGAGSPYTFSDPSLDLALISLDQRVPESMFADQLISHGFVPIPSEDIANEPEAEGQEVFTVGFPSSTALVGQITQNAASALWSSNHFSLPVSSFGRVSMLHHELPWFWADISIYPGNSGGPVVANDRLVGIVSSQAIIPVEGAPDARTRIPFGRIVKTRFVHALLKEQERRDRQLANPSTERKCNRPASPAGGSVKR